MILEWGRYKGRDLRNVPREYVEFLLEESQRTTAACREELQRREQADEASLPMIERIVAVGFRTLARQHHPDCGGFDGDMRELNAANEALREMLVSMREVKGMGDTL